MRFVCQLDYASIPYPTRTDTPEDEFGHRSTVSTSACGLCSAIMVVDRLLVDYRFDVQDAVDLALESKANHGPGTDMLIFHKAVSEKFGLKSYMSNSIEDVIMCLKTGGAVIANVQNTPEHKAIFTKGAHYIAVVDVAQDGRLVVLDPSIKEGKYDWAIELGLVEQDGRICYVTPDVLDAEGYTGHKYYLFWRK